MVTGLAAIGLGLAGAFVGIPVAAIAYDTRATGPVRLPQRWWRGGPARPPLVVLTAVCAGAAAAVVGAALPPDLALPAFWLFAVVGVGLAIIDVRSRRLPHRLTGLVCVSSALCFMADATQGGTVGPLLRAVGSGAATATILLLLALALPGQLGLGDVALASVVTFTLGWLGLQTALTGLLAGLLLQSATAIVAKLRHRSGTTMPMGPALVAGWLLALVLNG